MGRHAKNSILKPNQTEFTMVISIAEKGIIEVLWFIQVANLKETNSKENSKMVKYLARANFTRLTAACLLGNMSTESERVMVSKRIQMVTTTKETTQTARETDKASITMLMAPTIMENGSMVDKLGTVCILFPMEVYTKVTGSMGLGKAREL